MYSSFNNNFYQNIKVIKISDLDGKHVFNSIHPLQKGYAPSSSPSRLRVIISILNSYNNPQHIKDYTKLILFFLEGSCAQIHYIVQCANLVRSHQTINEITSKCKKKNALEAY